MTITSSNALTTISEILETENTRLDEKTAAVLSLEFEQARIQRITENYQQRTAAYNQIIQILILVFLICLVLAITQRFFPIIPAKIISFFVLLIGFYFAGKKYFDYSKRSKADFNVLETSSNLPMTLDEKTRALSQSADKGDLSGIISSSICTGPACCNPAPFTSVNNVGTKWSSEEKKCVPKTSTADGFVVHPLETPTPLTTTFSAPFMDYTPGEGEKYTKYA